MSWGREGGEVGGHESRRNEPGPGTRETRSRQNEDPDTSGLVNLTRDKSTESPSRTVVKPTSSSRLIPE